MLIGACVAMALPNLLFGIAQRRAAPLFFVLATVGVIGMAVAELAYMHAKSVEDFARALQWAQLPPFVLVVALVGFVRCYFRSGRLWLGIAAGAGRFVCLVLGFMAPPGLISNEITALRQVSFLGDTVSAPVVAIGSRTHISELSSLLFLIFVIDASITSWRQGQAVARRKALVIGGSIAFFILTAAGLVALTDRQILELPYLASFPFVVILVAMALELGSDLSCAGQVAQELQASHASLYESEERFRAAADAAPVPIWMAGTNKLCTFFNKAWLDFTGRTMEQELGNGWTEGVHVDDLEACVKTYGTAFDAREAFVMQYRLRYHDGAYRSITDRGVPRYDPNGNFRGYIGACVDITDLLKKERALHEFEERVTLAAEAVRFGVWELDIETNEIWMSEKARELFQFQPGTTVNYAAFQDRVHPEDRARRDSHIRRAIQEKGNYEMEYRTLLPDGTIRWIGARARCRADENGHVTRLLGISMDVTERKQAEELFHVATEASPSGTLLVDQEGRIVLANAHVEELFGYQREDLIGAPIEILLPERYAAKHPGHRANFFNAPQARPMGAGRELFARRKDGTEFPVEIGLNPIQTSRGILVLGSVVDISARKRAEEEARRRREQLDLLSRVSLLGEMTASLAHELNQPLAAIVHNADTGMEIIDNGNGDPAALRELLADVAADGCRAHEIIRNVRNTIKKGSAVRQPLSVNSAVLAVTRLVQADATAQSCEVETLLAKDLPTIIGDPVQIEQVLINLVTNAFDAMRDTPAGKRKVEIVTGRNGDASVRVSVRDQGSGISKDIKERLFEQFYTTKGEGLGMGLAIARSIVESHGGRIEAVNVPAGGAEFYFTLPILTST